MSEEAIKKIRENAEYITQELEKRKENRKIRISTVQTAAQVAGVTCPKDTGELDSDKTCDGCEHQKKCYDVIMKKTGGR